MTATKLWTVEELERQGAPEGRWELIDGRLVPMRVSSSFASSTTVWVATVLMNHVRRRRLGRLYDADGGFVLFPDRQTVRVVDVAVLQTDHLPAEEDRDGFPRRPPDLAIEVLAPSDHDEAVAAKVAMYLEAGTQLFWVVDPRARTVAVHVPGQPARVLGEWDELDGGNVLPDFKVVVADLLSYRDGFVFE